MGKRLLYVDGFRGLALFIMVTIQIFDVVATSSIYTTPPYYAEAINSVTWIPPSFFFTFVTGMSVFLLLRSRLNKGLNGVKLWLHVLKRYGKYVVISLPFTWFVFDLETFLAWNEAIQGIGATAIVLAGLYLLVNRTRIEWVHTWRGRTLLLALIGVFAVLQGWLPTLHGLNAVFPRDLAAASGFGTLIGSVVLNVVYRGWFSLANLLPMMIGGTVFLSLVLRENRVRDLFLYAGVFLAVSGALHFNGIPIDYYGRSISLTFFAVGESVLLYAGMYWLYQQPWKQYISRTLTLLELVGQTAFFIYVAHYVFIIKALKLVGGADTLPDPVSWAITVPLVGVMVAASYWYRKYRSVLPPYLQL